MSDRILARLTALVAMLETTYPAQFQPIFQGEECMACHRTSLVQRKSRSRPQTIEEAVVLLEEKERCLRDNIANFVRGKYCKQCGRGRHVFYQGIMPNKFPYSQRMRSSHRRSRSYSPRSSQSSRSRSPK